MCLILNIDTSTELASICLAENKECLFESTNNFQKEHASWLHPAIKTAFETTGKTMADLKAVGITAGPGSYTGLRVAMATAKGLCFALNIPLITVNTLEAMAGMATMEDTDLICPMIDAKRMEVFAGLYNKDLSSIIAPAAMILDENSFFLELANKKILFFGNGKNKFEKILSNKHAIFKNLIFKASHLSAVTYGKFIRSEFSSLQLTEPLYLKEYYTLYVSKS